MDGILAALRKTPWKDLCGRPVTEGKDYAAGLGGLPKSNVLSFCGEGFKVIIRPSGTEPKLKTYFLANDATEEQANRLAKSLCDTVQKMI